MSKDLSRITSRIGTTYTAAGSVVEISQYAMQGAVCGFYIYDDSDRLVRALVYPNMGMITTEADEKLFSQRYETAALICNAASRALVTGKRVAIIGKIRSLSKIDAEGRLIPGYMTVDSLFYENEIKLRPEDLGPFTYIECDGSVCTGQGMVLHVGISNTATPNICQANIVQLSGTAYNGVELWVRLDESALTVAEKRMAFHDKVKICTTFLDGVDSWDNAVWFRGEQVRAGVVNVGNKPGFQLQLLSKYHVNLLDMEDLSF